MKKWMKVVAAVVGLVIVLLVALVVLVNVLITPERVRETLLPLAEKNLNRKVELGDIKVSFFSGIEVDGLTIYEKQGGDVFVSTGLMRLKYQLLPLLAMKVVIDEVRLEKPTVRVERFKDGSFNFSDLTGGTKEAPTEAKPSGAEKGPPISLVVSNVIVTGGQLTFLDHALNNKTPYRYQLSDLEVAASGITLSGALPVKIQCLLNGSPLKVEGKVNLLPFGGDFDIDLQSLDLVAFSPYLKDALPGKLGGLKLTVKSNFSGNMDDMTLKGDVKLADLDFTPDAMPKVSLTDAVVGVSYNMQFKKGQELLHLEQLGLDYNGIRVNASGDVKSVMSKPMLDLSVSVPGLQLRDAINAVPGELTTAFSSLDPAGTVKVDAKISGTVDDAMALLKSARIELDNVQATAGGYRPALSGTLSLVGDNVKSDGLFVRIGDNRADIDLSARKLFAKMVIVEADVTSDRFDLDPLLKGGAGSAAASDLNGTVAKQPQAVEELGPFDIPVEAKGKLTIKETVWKGLKVDNFNASYELKNNILEIKRMEGQVAGGSFSNSARIDLGKKGLAYSANLGLKTVQADPILTAVLPKAAGSLLGAMNLDLNVNGSGTQWKTVSKKLGGQGDVLLTDGRITSPGLVKGFASFLQLPDRNEIRFSNFKGNIKIVDGKVMLDSSLLSDQIKLFPKGSIGLDGSLGLSLDTRLSPQLSGRLDTKGKVTKFLTDKEGWTQVPLLVSGSYASPSFGIDPKGLQGQATKMLSDQLGSKINKLLGGTENTQQDKQQGAEKPQEPVNKLLQDSLQKLFGN